MINKRQLAGLGFGAVVVAVSACAPTIRLEVAPIQIYAKLDADVRVRLDQELQQLLQQGRTPMTKMAWLARRPGA